MSKKKAVADKDAKKENQEVLAAEQEGDELETPPGDPPAVEEPPADPPEPEVQYFHNHDPRNAIAQRASASRTAQKKADDETLDDDGRVMSIKMEMEAAGESEEAILLRLHNEGYVPLDDDELARVREAVGESEPQEPEKKKKTPSIGKSNEAVDTSSDLVTIRVDGEDQQVARSEVEKAGIATLQKERNADRRQQELSQYEKNLRDYETRMRENFARGLDANGNPLTQAAKDKGLPEETGADFVTAVKEKAAAVRKAAFSGDDDAFEAALVDAITSVAQGRTSLTPPLDADQLVEQAVERLAQRNQRDQQKRTADTVNRTFREEFPELYEDDRGFTLTKAEFDRFRQAEPDADPVELMRRAGSAITELLKPKEPSLDDALERRRQNKAAENRRTPPPAGSQRKPPPKPDAPPPTGKQIVADMRRQRGLPV